MNPTVEQTKRAGCSCSNKDCACKNECSSHFCEFCREHCQEERPYCCGDEVPPKRPREPQPPGWQPGDGPRVSPFTPEMSGEEKFKAFDRAVFEIIRGSGR